MSFIVWVHPVSLKIPRGRSLPCPGQEAFARAIAEGARPTAAYERAGFEPAPSERETIIRCKALIRAKQIRRRVAEWKVEILEARAKSARSKEEAETVTTGELTVMLKRCYTTALEGLETPQVSAAVTAAMGLAKLHGRLTERHEVSVTQTLAVMSDEDLDALILELSAGAS